MKLSKPFCGTLLFVLWFFGMGASVGICSSFGGDGAFMVIVFALWIIGPPLIAVPFYIRRIAKNYRAAKHAESMEILKEFQEQGIFSDNEFIEKYERLKGENK
jgi:uncharacterized membrane protein